MAIINLRLLLLATIGTNLGQFVFSEKLLKIIPTTMFGTEQNYYTQKLKIVESLNVRHVYVCINSTLLMHVCSRYNSTRFCLCWKLYEYWNISITL